MFVERKMLVRRPKYFFFSLRHKIIRFSSIFFTFCETDFCGTKSIGIAELSEMANLC